MNREQVLFHINAIYRQLSCMNNEEFESHLKDNHFEATFDRFSFVKESKITVKIIMDEVDV